MCDSKCPKCQRNCPGNPGVPRAVSLTMLSDRSPVTVRPAGARSRWLSVSVGDVVLVSILAAILTGVAAALASIPLGFR